jgi:hypothetical protein
MTIRTQINRFKKTRGVPCKELRSKPQNKYADSEQWKRSKNVAIQRQSRRENVFDFKDSAIPKRKEEWPYEGISDYMEGLRKKHLLGAGW